MVLRLTRLPCAESAARETQVFQRVGLLVRAVVLVLAASVAVDEELAELLEAGIIFGDGSGFEWVGRDIITELREAGDA